MSTADYNQAILDALAQAQWKDEEAVIFESLQESNERGELLLLEGGYCRWHRRRDNVIVIYEIISQERGMGQVLLDRLIQQRPVAIVAKCPVDLPANEWYPRRNFWLERVETTRSGRQLNVWRHNLGNHPK